VLSTGKTFREFPDHQKGRCIKKKILEEKMAIARILEALEPFK
jgi:hypothetical protein